LDAPGTLNHVVARGIEKGWIVNEADDRKNFIRPMGKLSAGTKT